MSSSRALDSCCVFRHDRTRGRSGSSREPRIVGRLADGIALRGGGGCSSGRLTVFCLIGTNPPNSADEGIRLVVPGIINFNKVVSGENVYVRLD